MENKIAIKVENEREFKALMEHYKSKGWVKNHGASEKFHIHYPWIQYCDMCDAVHGNSEFDLVLPFETFASIAGIQLPPNEIIIEINQVYKAVVTNGNVKFIGACGAEVGLYWLSSEHIREIHTAMQSLNG